MLRGQFNISQLPIHKRREVGGGSVMMPASSGGGVADTPPAIIFDKIIQCGAELTSTNYILITLKSEQEQGSEDANYELLNYIYDNFEEHTDFFKRIKLRFLEASFDFPKYNNIESNWARLALKSYVKENDVWKVDAGKDVLEYHLCFDIRDFQLDKYDEQKAGSDQIIFDGKMFFYLSKNRMFMLDLYYRDVSVVLGNTKKRAFISSDIVNSGKLVLYGEQKDEVVDNVPTSAIELDYMLPALLFHIKNDAKMNINFNIKLAKKTGTQDKTKLIISYSSGSIQNPGTKFQGIEITGLIDGEFKDILFEEKDLLKCQFIKENPNKLQVFTNYNMQPFIDEMKDELANLLNEISNIKDEINNIEGADLTEILNEIAEINNKITNILEVELVNIQNNFSGITLEITNIKNEISNIKNDITNIKNEITNTKNEITNIKNDITIIKSSIDPIEKSGVWRKSSDYPIPSPPNKFIFQPIPSKYDEFVLPEGYTLVLEWRAQTGFSGEGPTTNMELYNETMMALAGPFPMYDSTRNLMKISEIFNNYTTAVFSWSEIIVGGSTPYEFRWKQGMYDVTTMTQPNIRYLVWSYYSQAGLYWMWCHWKIVRSKP